MKKYIAFDEYVVLNVLSIRTVTWGESQHTYHREDAGKPFFVEVTFKNGREKFNYRTGEQARELFVKIRNAMTGVNDVQG